MSALYGKLQSDTGSEKTKTGNKWIIAKVQSWEVIVKVELDNGSLCEVTATDADGNHKHTLWEGNVGFLVARPA